MKRDPMASEAVKTAIALTAWWHGKGLEHAELRRIMTEVSALADGKAREISRPAMAVYEVIRARSKGTAEQVQEFVGLLAEALDHIEVVDDSEEVEPC